VETPNEGGIDPGGVSASRYGVADGIAHGGLGVGLETGARLGKIEARPQGTFVVVDIKTLCGPSFCAGSGPILQRQFHIQIPTLNQLRSYALYRLQDLLEKSGKSLEECKLPLPTIRFENLDGTSRLMAQQLNYDPIALDEIWTTGYMSTNPSQRHILDTITHSLDTDEFGLFFIDGPGGTGKTFIENLILAYVRKRGGIALAVASSGIAALLLEGGRTSHSQFKIPIEINSESLCTFHAQTQLADLIRATNLIIWDEAPAQHRHCFEAVDRTFKDIRQSDEWFGGIPIIFAGTFKTPIASID